MFVFLAQLISFKRYTNHLHRVNLESQTSLIEMLKLTFSTNLISLLDSYSHVTKRMQCSCKQLTHLYIAGKY